MSPISDRINSKKYSPEFTAYLNQCGRTSQPQNEEDISVLLNEILQRAEAALEFYNRYDNKTSGHAGKYRAKAEQNFKQAVLDYRLVTSASRDIIISSLSEKSIISKSLQDEIVYLDKNAAAKNSKARTPMPPNISENDLVVPLDLKNTSNSSKSGRKLLTSYKIRHLRDLNPGRNITFKTSIYTSTVYLDELNTISETLLKDASIGQTFYEVAVNCFGLMRTIIDRFNATVNKS